MTVAVVDGNYDILLECADYSDNYKQYSARFVGQIEGFTLPVEEDNSANGTGTQDDPYKFTLEAMTESGYVSYDFSTASGLAFHLETNWTQGTQEGEFTFAGSNDPIPAQYCGVNSQFGSVAQGGYVKFSKNGDNWRIDVLVPYSGGEFYAYYEGPLKR